MSTLFWNKATTVAVTLKIYHPPPLKKKQEKLSYEIIYEIVSVLTGADPEQDLTGTHLLLPKMICYYMKNP